MALYEALFGMMDLQAAQVQPDAAGLNRCVHASCKLLLAWQLRGTQEICCMNSVRHSSLALLPGRCW